MAIVLASASPRRKQILTMLGFKDFLVIPARGEECPPAGAAPEEIVRCLARAKAEEVSKNCSPDDIVVAADTIVWYNNTVYGKPASAEEAFEMLSSLSGNTHAVYTGVCLIRGNEFQCEAEKSLVSFRHVSEKEIRGYISTGEPFDKAGAYAAQGKAAPFVERIEGDFFNVMGLPVCRFCEMLKSLGVELF